MVVSSPTSRNEYVYYIIMSMYSILELCIISPKCINIHRLWQTPKKDYLWWDSVLLFQTTVYIYIETMYSRIFSTSFTIHYSNIVHSTKRPKYGAEFILNIKRKLLYPWGINEFIMNFCLLLSWWLVFYGLLYTW